MKSLSVMGCILAPRPAACSDEGLPVAGPELIDCLKFIAADSCWMDALSEAMRAVRLTSALFFNGEFSAPWRFATPGQDKVAPIVSPDSERLVLFHLVTDGEATARTAGHDEVALTAGDIVVFPQGDAHELWRGRTSKLFPGARLLPKLSKGELAAEKWGGPGAVTRIICGYLGCESHADSSFLSGLPPIFKVNLRSSPAGAWIESAIRNGVSEIESKRAGRLAVLAKLAETLFVETLCRYMDDLPSERDGLACHGARSKSRARRSRSCIATPRAHGRCPIWHGRAERRERC